MSDAPQGTGWWQASDGRWYPPESHPNYRPPAGAGYPPPPAAGGFGPPAVGGGHVPYAGPGPYVAPTAPKTGMSTTAKVLLAIGLVLVLGVGGCAVVAGLVVSKAAKTVSSAVGSSNGSCDFVAADKAGAALGGKATLTPLRGIVSLANIALDSRVLADAPSCLVTVGEGKSSVVGRVARLQSSSAHDVFTTELAKAKGGVVSESTSSSEGGSSNIKVESQGYLLRTVELGDEAFCTAFGAMPMSGVLVRRGDTLVYVSLLPNEADASTVSVASDGTHLSTDDTNCDLAQKLAKVVLDG